MRRMKLLRGIYRRIHASHIGLGFVVFVFAVSGIFLLLEPTIPNYGEALWYTYVNMFTIGFGDIVPQHPVSRILSVILTTYATVVIALFTGGLVSYYQETKKADHDAQQTLDQDLLRRLHKLSPEQLEQLSRQFKEQQNLAFENAELNQEKDRIKNEIEDQKEQLRQNQRKIIKLKEAIRTTRNRKS